METTLNLLIGKSDLEPYAQVSINLKDERFLHPSILSAQNMDIKPVFGNLFWTDLLKNVNSADNKKLLEGGEYTVDGKDYSFQGLKASIACFAYARYVYGRNSVDTPFGMVQKSSEYSTPTDSKLLSQIAGASRASGEQYLQEVVEYIKLNPTLFPLYFESCAKRSSSKGSARLTPASRF